MLMLIVNLLFWTLLGLWFLGVRFLYIDKIIGACALIIAVSLLL